jgi:hypothetical protein
MKERNRPEDRNDTTLRTVEGQPLPSHQAMIIPQCNQQKLPSGLIPSPLTWTCIQSFRPIAGVTTEMKTNEEEEEERS